MRLNIPCGVRMRKVCTHLEHICVKNVLECSFMHDLLFITLLTLVMIVQQVVYNFTHFGYDCATGCLQK